MAASSTAAGAISACADDDSLSPFDYLTTDIHARRRASAERVKIIAADAAAKLAALGPHPDAAAVAALKATAALEAHRALYGNAPECDPGARERYLAQYGCARWTDAALAAVRAAAGPRGVIEIGAGRGQWAAALEARGVDVLAFDSYAEIPQGATEASRARVRAGNETELLKRAHRGRTLFLCYPPPVRDARRCMALRSVAYYARALNLVSRERGGDGGEPARIVYVGEGRGGANACGAFFDMLDREWEVERVMELDPWPGNHERLFVLRRRQRK